MVNVIVINSITVSPNPTIINHGLIITVNATTENVTWRRVGTMTIAQLRKWKWGRQYGN